MTENEAIDRIKTGICCEKGTVRYCTDACMYGKEKCAYSVAIKALKEIQQYRELEKRLTGMFSGELSLETVVDELERQLKEPDNPHPINAKILTYEDAAAWDAYHAIGTPEECQKSVAVCKSMIDRKITPENMEEYMKFEDECVKNGFTFDSLLKAREKQTAKKVKSISRVKDGDSYVGLIGRCPCCGDILEEDTVYCDCGQKLDWNTDTVADQEDTEARR